MAVVDNRPLVGLGKESGRRPSGALRRELLTIFSCQQQDNPGHYGRPQ